MPRICRLGYGGFLLIALGVAQATSAIAQGSGTSAPVYLDRIVVQDDGIYLFPASGSFLNPDACASSATIVIPPGSPLLSHYSSAAMTALAARKSMHVWVSGCQMAPWYPSVPKVVSITLYGQ